MTREEFYIKIDQLAEEYSGVEKVLKLMELLTKYNVPLEQRNTELEQRVKELEEPKTYESCETCRHRNHLANETDPCNSCIRRMVYMGYSNDSYEPRETK